MASVVVLQGARTDRRVGIGCIVQKTLTTSNVQYRTPNSKRKRAAQRRGYRFLAFRLTIHRKDPSDVQAGVSLSHGKNAIC
jgi:hypothetical protein